MLRGKGWWGEIRDPLARGPYPSTGDGYRLKFDERRKKMIQAYNDMRGVRRYS